MENQSYASFLKRFLAVLLDGLITVIPFTMIIWVPLFILILGGVQKEAAQAISELLSILLAWIYNALMESSPMQGTLGKMICKIKVTDLNGERITFARASGRFFGKNLSALLLFTGYIMAAFTQRRQALHDILAGTLVLEGRPASVGVAAGDPIDI